MASTPSTADTASLPAAAQAPAPKADIAPVAAAKAPAPVAKAAPVAAPVLKAPALKAPALKAQTAKVKAKSVTAAARKPVAKKKAAMKPAKVRPAIKSTTKPFAKAKALIKKEVVTMENTAKTVADKTQAYFADAQGRAKSTMEKGSKVFEDMNAFSKGNLEALVESSKIAAKGFESMGQDAAEYSRKQFEAATATLKSLSSVKSPTELFKLHSDYVRSAFDSIVAETSKNTETMLKLAGEIAQPLQNRVAVAVEKVKVAA